MTTEPVWIPTRTDSFTRCSVARPPVERGNLIDDREAGADCALCVVLVRLRPAEVDHQAVAEILGDVTAKASDRRCRVTLILRRDLAPVFGIQMSRDFSRTDQV